MSRDNSVQSTLKQHLVERRGNPHESRDVVCRHARHDPIEKEQALLRKREWRMCPEPISVREIAGAAAAKGLLPRSFLALRELCEEPLGLFVGQPFQLRDELRGFISLGLAHQRDDLGRE